MNLMMELTMGWSFEDYTMFLLMVLLLPTWFFHIWCYDWNKFFDEMIKDLTVPGTGLDFDGLSYDVVEKKLDKTIEKVGNTIDDYIEQVKEKINLINDIAEAVSLKIDTETWKRKDIRERVKQILGRLKEITSERVKQVKRLDEKISKLSIDFSKGFDELAQSLGIRTNLQTWKDKNIAARFKFMASKARKLRREAGYDD